jgi:hypothetical protein
VRANSGSLHRGHTEVESRPPVAQADVPPLPGDDPALRCLDAVLRRALARDPAHRHDSARAFAGDLCQAIAAYGAPMVASEIQANVSTWLGPSLLRHGRELAALVGGWQPLEEMPGEHTLLHAPSPVAGVRLRDVSVAVGDAAQASESFPAASPADTLIDVPLVSPLDAPGVTIPMPSGELTPSRVATAVTIEAPGFTIGEPTTVLRQRRAASSEPVAPRGPEPVPTPILPEPSPIARRRLSILLVIAVLGLEAGVVVGRLLA